MKTVCCKTCGKEIAKSAKICPNCGAKLKRPVFGYIILVIGIIGLIGAIWGNSDEPKKVADTSAKNVERVSEEPQKFSVGDVVELNDVNVTLVQVHENNGSEYNRPTDGNVFLLCEFEIENNSSKEIAVSSMLSFEAYCDDYACNLSLAALIEKGNKNQLDGSVASGKKFSGVVGYEVPLDWSELEIRFAPDWWGKDIIFVAYN